MRLLIISIFTLYYCVSMAQSYLGDTTFVTDAAKNSVKNYYHLTGPQSHIYNGNSYIEYQQQDDEHPYFINEWIEGSIVYEGEYYENIPMLYDISNDKVITDHQYNIHKIQLINEKISRFAIKDHLFVHLIKTELPTGFYEILYDGKIKVYLRWKKTLQETATSQIIEKRFDEKTSYYLLKEGKFHSVKTKRALLAVLKDRKSDLKKFMHTNKIKFKTNRSQNIAQLASHYDQLSATK